MKFLYLTVLLLFSAPLHTMEPAPKLVESKEEIYFDSLSKDDNKFVGFSCGPLVKARHIPTGRIIAAYFPIGGMGWGYSGCVYLENNSKVGYDLDSKTSETVFESLEKAYTETNVSKKNAILANLHKVVTELEAKK